MIPVIEAQHRILATSKNYGSELVPLGLGIGRVLDEDLLADRDFPPYDRVAMDGICIRYEAYSKGLRKFRIMDKIAAGTPQNELKDSTSCFEIMTGASLPVGADTVVRYEDVKITDNQAILTLDSITKAQNVHHQATDRNAGELLVKSPVRIDPAVIGIAASIGKDQLSVKKWPMIMIISSGDELIDVAKIPQPHQIRRSNTLTLKSVFDKWNIPVAMDHIPDDEKTIRERIRKYLSYYDVLIVSGGVSKGKFDFLPEVLNQLGVEKIFHRINQKPGKPFWFGKLEDSCRVFALPGNPVSTYMCFWVYLLPWLRKSLGLKNQAWSRGVLLDSLQYRAGLDFFVPAFWEIKAGRVAIKLYPGRGSGDHANLLRSNCIAHFPPNRDAYFPGELISFLPTKEHFI